MTTIDEAIIIKSGEFDLSLSIPLRLFTFPPLFLSFTLHSSHSHLHSSIEIMLEEALQDESHDPTDTAVAMLSFVQSLSVSGAVAEARFCRSLFVPLCERVFGTLETPDAMTTGNCWLSATQRWVVSPSVRRAMQPTSSNSTSSNNTTTTRSPSAIGRVSPSKLGSNNNSNTAMLSLDQHPIMELLATAEPTTPWILQAITEESENRVGYALVLHTLPVRVQKTWMAAMHNSQMSMNTNTMGGSNSSSQSNPQQQGILSSNDQQLFFELLRFSPLEQFRKFAFSAPPAASAASSSSWNSPHTPGATSPLVSRQSQQTPFYQSPMSLQQQQSKQQQQQQQSSPTIMLSMLEYYLIFLFRFAMALPKSLVPQTQQQSPSMYLSKMAHPYQQQQQQLPFGQVAYLHLFRRYCRHFLASNNEEVKSARSSNPYALQQQQPVSPSQLFLRLLITFWLEAMTPLQTTEHMVKVWQQRQQRLSSSSSTATAFPTTTIDLDQSYDLVQLNNELVDSRLTAASLSAPLKESLRYLVYLLVAQPAVWKQLQSCHTTSNDDDDNNNNEICCLTVPMATLQQPLYNFIRCMFRFASIHGSTTTSAFSVAMDLWLTWLEPWKQQTAATTTSNKRPLSSLATTSHPAPRQSRFDRQQWEPYVVANVYMYVVPLAIFLRRARELDFDKFQLSMNMVRRVFNVFTPDLLQVLQTALRNESRFPQQLQLHRQRLGEFAPPGVTANNISSMLTLSSCQADMRLLLEEMQLHHFKKVDGMDLLDRMAAKVEGWFGKGVVTGEEASLRPLVERAVLMVNLPATYSQEFFARPTTVTTTGAGTFADATDGGDRRPKPSRNKDGTLTEEGRMQLIRGEAVCSVLDVHAKNDYYTRRKHVVVGTYEVAILVEVFMQLSDWINDRLILPWGWKIELRCLADYRNLVWTCMGLYLSWRFML